MAHGIVSANVSRLEHARVKTAHPPSWRLGVESLDPGVVDLIFQRFAIHVKRAAGSPGLRNFEEGATGRQTVADPQLRQQEASRGEVLPEGAVKQGMVTCYQIIDHFRRDKKNGFPRSAVDAGVRVRIAFQALFGDKASRNRAFREASPRSVYLNDSTHIKRSAVSSQLSAKPR